MADITHILKGKFDRQDINEIMVALRAAPLSSADRIHVSLQGRRARINNRQFRNLSKRIALSGIALTEGALGTKLSEFTMATVDAGATATTGISYSVADDSLWLIDNAAQKIFNAETNGTKKSEFTIAAFSAPLDAQGIDIDSNGDLWIISVSPGKVFKVDNTGTLISSFLTDVFLGNVDPSDIAYDEITDSLWITETNADYIYNVTTSGVLISQHGLGGFAPSGSAMSGIAIKNNKLFLTSPTAPATIYKTTTGGNAIYSYASSVYDVLATQPVGITVAPDSTHWIIDTDEQKVYNVMGADLGSWLGEGLIIHSDNGFNKRINN